MVSLSAGISTSRANTLNQVIAKLSWLYRHFWIFASICIVSECVTRISTCFFFSKFNTDYNNTMIYGGGRKKNHCDRSHLMAAFTTWLTGHLVANFVWMLCEIVLQILSRVSHHYWNQWKRWTRNSSLNPCFKHSFTCCHLNDSVHFQVRFYDYEGEEEETKKKMVKTSYNVQIIWQKESG